MKIEGVSAAVACQKKTRRINSGPYSLYLMQAKDYDWCKIGISKNPESRLEELTVPFHLTLVISIEIGGLSLAKHVENSVHEFYYDRKIKREWFRSVDVEDFKKVSKEFLSKTLCPNNNTKKYKSGVQPKTTQTSVWDKQY